MKTLTFLAMLCAGARLFAQQTAPWTTLKIKSAPLADTRTIYVATPAG